MDDGIRADRAIDSSLKIVFQIAREHSIGKEDKNLLTWSRAEPPREGLKRQKSAAGIVTVFQCPASRGLIDGVQGPR